MVAFAASAASAATLSIVSDKTTYNVGETISLTVTGDDGGATTYGVQGRVDFNGALVNLGSVTQTQLAGPYGKFTVGTTPSLDNGGAGSFQFMFNQTSGAPQEATNSPGTVAIGTLIAQAAGTVNLVWHANQVDGFGLEFFGLSDAPGTSFTIVAVPEPTTAGLLGLGLVGLLLGGRRRRA
jgi:hypothetical protein